MIKEENTMKKNNENNKFIIKEVFSPNAINIEEKMREVFMIYLSEKLVNFRNENNENNLMQ